MYVFKTDQVLSIIFSMILVYIFEVGKHLKSLLPLIYLVTSGFVNCTLTTLLFASDGNSRYYVILRWLYQATMSFNSGIVVTANDNQVQQRDH